ncbi:glycosyltransferase [Demequina subtropica]|uniref:glycosyltransferase n=1 Tax=Demequina subtropica TaxID=1638989 RepID=UPI0009E2AAB1|nr:glycosyltransferase [Demequina subtropica]
MRIVHIAPGLSRRLGGPSALLRGLVPAQVERGHRVTIVVTDQGAELEGDLEVPGADVHVVPAVGPAFLGYGRGLRKAIRGAVADADVVEVHGVYSLASVFGMSESRRARVPYLAAPHGVWTADHAPRRPWLNAAWDRLLLAQNLRDAQMIVSDSLYDRDCLLERGFSRVANMVLGVDPVLRSIETPWEERSGVLFLSRVARKKRLDLAIEAYARSGLAEQGHPFVVAGPIEEGLPYDPRELCAEHGVAEHVEFLGTVTSEQRRDLLSRMRVFVLASDDESFGMAVAEAAAAGMAVVASDRVAAIREAEQFGAGRGWPQDPGALATALAEAAADDAGAQAAVLRDFARASWTWEHAVEQFDAMASAAPVTAR